MRQLTRLRAPNQKINSMQSLSSLMQEGTKEAKGRRSSNTKLLLTAKRLFTHPDFDNFKAVCEMLEVIKHGKKSNTLREGRSRSATLSSSYGYLSPEALAKDIGNLLGEGGPFTDGKLEILLESYNINTENLSSITRSLKRLQTTSEDEYEELANSLMEFVGTEAEESSCKMSKSRMRSRYNSRASQRSMQLRSLSKEVEEEEEEEEEDSLSLEDLFNEFDENEDETLDLKEFEDGFEEVEDETLEELFMNKEESRSRNRLRATSSKRAVISRPLRFSKQQIASRVRALQ